jgi:hypothetical protein
MSTIKSLVIFLLVELAGDTMAGRPCSPLPPSARTPAVVPAHIPGRCVVPSSSLQLGHVLFLSAQFPWPVLCSDSARQAPSRVSSHGLSLPVARVVAWPQLRPVAAPMALGHLCARPWRFPARLNSARFRLPRALKLLLSRPAELLPSPFTELPTALLVDRTPKPSSSAPPSLLLSPGVLCSLQLQQPAGFPMAQESLASARRPPVPRPCPSARPSAPRARQLAQPPCSLLQLPGCRALCRVLPASRVLPHPHGAQLGLRDATLTHGGHRRVFPWLAPP